MLQLLASRHIKPEHLSHTIASNAVGDDDGHGLHPLVLSHVLVAGIDIDVRVVRVQAAREEGLHLTIKHGTKPAHLALGKPSNP